MLEQRRWRSTIAATLPLRPQKRFYDAARAFWQARGVERSLESIGGDKGRLHSPVLGVHLRGTDRACMINAEAYMPLIRAYICRWPRAKLFAATDDARMLETLRELLRNESLDRLPASSQSSDVAERLLTREDVIRGRSGEKGRLSKNPGVHARGKHAVAAPIPGQTQTGLELNASTTAKLGSDVLLDTLLLSQTDFLIGSVSAVSSYAILFSPRLHTRSFIMDVVGQPPPKWRNACPPASPPPPSRGLTCSCASVSDAAGGKTTEGCRCQR